MALNPASQLKRGQSQMIRPENWWGVGVDPLVLYRIAEEDGIPVAWVPDQSVLKDHPEAVLGRLTRTSPSSDREQGPLPDNTLERV